MGQPAASRRVIRLLCNPRRVVLLAEVRFWLLLAYLLRSCLPLQKAVRFLGFQAVDNRQLCHIATAHYSKLPSDKVGRSIENIAARLGLKRSCVLTAYAARMYLRVRGVPCILVLGVANASKKPLAAHAWLIANGSTMTGYRGVEKYTAVCAFIPARSKKNIKVVSP